MTSTTPTEIATPAPGRRGAARLEAASLLGLLVLSLALGGSGGIAGVLARVATWGALMLVPGWVIWRLTAGRTPDPVDGALLALVLSPVAVAALAALGLLAGVSPAAAGRATAVVAVLAGILGLARAGRSLAAKPPAREIAAVVALFVVIAILTAWLPMTREWWRIRSDAWFHAAVVAQIAHDGLPPEDPYFLGMPLQYMWLYHAMVLELSRMMHIDAFRVMALVNIQALAALTAAAYRLASTFHARLAHRITATAALLLSFNAAFWVLLPVKFIRAASGDVRGIDEISRTFSLSPFNYKTASGFLTIYFNQEFFLDKYMVATAFGLALAFMVSAWSATASYLGTGRRINLVLLGGAMIGMLGFHSMVGFVMLVAVFGGALLSHVARRHIDGYRFRGMAVVLAVSLGCFIAMLPYLYEVMHLKEHDQIFPLSCSFSKTASIFIPSAFVLVMALRARAFRVDRTLASRFFVFASVAVTAFCLSIRLPGPNTYDKLGYFVFIPLSIPAGFAVADSIVARSGIRRRLVAGSWALLFFLPVNAIAIASCFASPNEVQATPGEMRLTAWVREHTSRDAVFIDDADRVFLVVTGPRRYLFGRWAYAWQWGYPRLEMSRRFHARGALYRTNPLDAETLDVLAGVRDPLYVIIRPEHRAAGAAVLDRSDLFTSVYSDGGLALYRVDTDACRRAQAVAPAGPSSEVLLHESGL